jgi:ElaB/YqjD/DUF883 family membrane-anchored ribosome-binding protein
VTITSICAVIAAIVLMSVAYRFWIKPTPSLVIAKSYVPYAGVIAASAALERFLEPLSSLLMNTKAQQAKKEAASAKSAAQTAGADPVIEAAQVHEQTQTAANAQAKADTERANRTVFFWAIASICGIGIAGGFGFFLLQSIATGVNPYLDLAVTGLTIGAGTKPTHDLITSLQAKSSGSSSSS